MEFMISGRNVAVSDRFRQYAAEKIGKVENLGNKVQRVDARVTKHENIREADSSLTVELTVLGRGPVVRAEASSADKFAAFDLAYGKLMERLRRASDRRKVHHGRHTPLAVRVATAGLEPARTAEPLAAQVAAEEPDPMEGNGADQETQTGECPVLIRRKVFPGAPMSLDDAVDNMELVGHDFYLFVDSATGAPSVVYRRKGWTYGVITLDSKCAEGEQELREEMRGYRDNTVVTEGIEATA
ncbi:ribosome hibernation-promoting factor, HPF/YfiA family [Arthrobacter sp. 7Tela_A1]|uniref:ribosome hibernation-promoting factor, HPF/YfiA family n=1 Tax=Arthrobacter sp. 7Tela_A1 TaxID=3093745 RepID=UPI003BB6C5D4